MLQSNLYLDDARIGRLRPEAKRLYHSFVEFAASNPTSRNVLDLLTKGSRCSGLANPYEEKADIEWEGIDAFKQLVASAHGGIASSNVYLASRTKSLMQIGSRAISRLARNPLCFDLNWSAYQRNLADSIQAAGGYVSGVNLREQILCQHWDSDRVCNAVFAAYTKQKCDSLFLPAVDSYGIRIPIRTIVERIREQHEIRFVLVDAAQAFGHVDTSDLVGIADLIIGGTHKWVGSYLPLGVGIACNTHTQRHIADSITRSMVSNVCDDNLMRFLSCLCGAERVDASETVNLCPLFAGYGASAMVTELPTSLANRLANADMVSDISPDYGWKPVRPTRDLRTGILLLENSLRIGKQNRPLTQEMIESAFASAGVQLTGMPNGLVRLAMPSSPLTKQQVDVITSALQNVSQHFENDRTWSIPRMQAEIPKQIVA